jgi:hypothetical protein
VSYRNLGPARLRTFMEWATELVLDEAPAWVLVKTPNGTARWAKPARTVKRVKARRRG